MITESINRMSDIEVPANPFPGLRPFEFDESHLYFGRDGQNEQLLRKLSSTRFVAVVGTSGSGKSSLVRAGLLPTLYGGSLTSAGSNWRVALMRPGNDPLGNLARALNSADVFGSEIAENAELQTTITEATLRRGSLGLVEAVRQNRMPENENLLVIADQFEELFRYAQVAGGDERYQNEAAAFVKLLLEAARQREINIYVVLTLRSDYIGDCSLFWDLPEAINEGQYLIPRLTREQRREAVTGPVAVGGAHITPRLVNRLLNEMGDNPDQLPILQHALMRTWDNWKQEGKPDEPIDLHHYEAIGGMSEALSRHADEAYFELPDERSRLLAERIFKALTEKGKDNRETRRQTELRVLCAVVEASEQEVISVIEPFRREGRSFLMPPAATPLRADSLIDISHESLIRNWQRLSQWVEEESRSVRIYQRLADTAALHQKGEAGLWHDPDLQLALNWREQSRPNSVWAERYHTDFAGAMAFLDKSREAREREAEESRKELRRARIIAAILFFAFLISLGSTVYAFSQQREATRQTKIAQQQTLIANQAFTQSEVERVNAERERLNAEAASAIATTEREKADESKSVALLEKKKAEEAKLQALEQARIARENAHRAETEKRAAEAARSATEAQRQLAVKETERAEAKTKENARLLYAANINLAQQAYDNKEVSRAQEFLDALWPQKDLLGFEWYYLWRRYHSNLTTFKGHTESVSSVAVSPDGKTLATGSWDSTVKLWNLATGQEITTLKGHKGAVSAVAFSPDGKTLATGGNDKSVKLWDALSGRELATLAGQSGYIRSVAFSPDGKTLFSASNDENANTVKLWDTASGRELATLTGHEEMITSMALSPDGRTLATAGIRELKFWDVATRRELASLVGDNVNVIALAFSPDGKTLATGGVKTVKLWDIASRQELATLTGHTDDVNSVAFSPDGRTLASGGDDSVVKLWDIASRRELTTLKYHTDAVVGVAFTPDGKALVTGSGDRTARLWKTTSQDELMTLRGHKDAVWSATFIADGKTLATAGMDNTLKLWDVASRREISSFKDETGAINSVAFSPDGKILATNDKEVAALKLWDVASGRVVATLSGNDILSMAFSPDGKILATHNRGEDNVKLRDGLSGQELATLTGQEEMSSVMAFSPDGKTLAVGGESVIKLWDVVSRRELLQLKGHTDWLGSVAFSPDGKVLATGSHDKTIKLWDTATGRELKTLIGHANSVNAVAFSPDGRTLATGGADNVVKLWSAATYQELVTLRGHLGAISSIAFSPDGKTLATAGYDNNVKLWYAATDEEVMAGRGKDEGRLFGLPPVPYQYKGGPEVGMRVVLAVGAFELTASELDLSLSQRFGFLRAGP